MTSKFSWWAMDEQAAWSFQGRPFLRLSHGINFVNIFFLIYINFRYENVTDFLFSLALKIFLLAAQVGLCFNKIKLSTTNYQAVPFQAPSHRAAILATAAHPSIKTYIYTLYLH